MLFDFQAISREKLFSNLSDKNYPAERRRGNLIHSEYNTSFVWNNDCLVSAPWVDTKMNIQFLYTQLSMIIDY